MPRMKLPTQPNTCAWPWAWSQAGEMKATLSRPLICRRFHTPRNVPGNSMKKSPDVTKAMSKRDNDSSLARTRAITSARESAGPLCGAVAISASDTGARAALCGGGFQLYRAREKNVVFEMYMKVQVLLKFFERLIRRLVARAAISRSLVSVAS